MNMEQKHPISELIGTTMEKIKDMVDANTIVGQPITTGDGMMLIPISKVSFGFGTGGSDFSKNSQKADPTKGFGGGSGAGASVSPIAFLVVKGDSVKLLPVSAPAGTTIDRLVDMVPDLLDKVTEHMAKKSTKDKEEVL